jgi:hypothetical protein
MKVLVDQRAVVNLSYFECKLALLSALLLFCRDFFPRFRQIPIAIPIHIQSITILHQPDLGFRFQPKDE